MLGKRRKDEKKKNQLIRIIARSKKWNNKFSYKQVEHILPLKYQDKQSLYISTKNTPSAIAVN
jgi:hypothetical protein